MQSIVLTRFQYSLGSVCTARILLEQAQRPGRSNEAALLYSRNPGRRKRNASGCGMDFYWNSTAGDSFTTGKGLVR